MRVNIDGRKVHSMIERRIGVERAAEFMASRQRDVTRSRRLRNAVTTETGRDARGWYARAGIADKPAAFFWYFEEHNTGRGSGHPFIRQALWGNTARVVRLLLGKG